MSDTPPTRSDAPKRRPLTGRRLLWGLAGAFLLLVLVAAFGAWRTIGAAKETIAQHRARLPAEHAALAALPRGRPPLLEPAQEGEATAVVEAFLAAVEAVPKADREKQGDYQPDPVPAEEIAAIVAAHPEPVVALKAILHVKSSPPPPAADVQQWWASMTRWQEGSRWLASAAKRAVEQGDGHAAREIAALHVAFGQEVAQSGNMLAVLVGEAIERRGVKDLVAASSASPIDADEARRLGAGLEAADATRPSLATAVQMERYAYRYLTTSMKAPGPLDARELGWRHLWSWDVYRAKGLDAWDARVDEIAAAVLATAGDASLAVSRAKAVAGAPDHGGLRGGLWGVSILIERTAVTRAQTRVARVSLAVAEYAARRGSFPATLSDLVPEYLAAVPPDPWDGAPLRYAAGKVWSVGMDKKDGGGTPPTDPDDDIGRDGDVVAPAPRVK